MLGLSHRDTVKTLSKLQGMLEQGKQVRVMESRMVPIQGGTEPMSLYHIVGRFTFLLGRVRGSERILLTSSPYICVDRDGKPISRHIIWSKTLGL